MIIMITGAGGFIGSNLANALSRLGHRIVICDNVDERKLNYLARCNIEDIIWPEEAANFVGKYHPDVVIHLGATTDTMCTNPREILDNNYKNTIKMFLTCKYHSRFIYASSAATYGDGKYGFHDRCDDGYLSRLCPLNLYGWSKHLADRKIIKSTTPPDSCMGLKFFNVYGPNEDHKGNMRSMIKKIYDDLKNNGYTSLFNENVYRDFIHVDDCVSIIMWLIDRTDYSGIMNVGTGNAASMDYVARIIAEKVGIHPDQAIKKIDMPDNLKGRYQYFTNAELSSLKNMGYPKSLMSIEEGIDKYIKHIENQ